MTPDPDEPRWRRRLVRVLLVVGGILAALGLIAGHVNRQALDGPRFADHVDAIRRDDAVATQVGRSVATQIIRSRPDLVALGPLVESVSIRAAGSDALSPPVQRSAEAAHVALTDPGADSVVLRLADLGAVVAGVLAAVAPDRAPAAADISVTLLSVGDQSFASGVIAVAHAVDLLAWLLPLGAVLCLGGAVVIARDRWLVAMRAGWSLLGAATGVGVALLVGGFLVRRVDLDTLGGAVAQAGWREVVRPLWWGVTALTVVGLTMVLTCGSAVPEALRARGEQIRATIVRRPATSLGIAVRATVVALAGLATLTDPSGMIELVAFVVGVGLVLFGVTEIAGLGADARQQRRTDGGAPLLATETSTHRRRVLIVGGAATALAVGGVALLASPGRDVDVDAGATDVEVCNGHAELCDRTFDEVAYIASHNSMAVATEPGWFLAEQLDPIVDQLDQGVRALLIDVWSGRPADSVVRTAASSYEEALAVTEAELGPDVVAAAGRIITAAAGQAEGPEARFMCHGLCETGSTSFLEMLDALRNWMAVNPAEVVTLFIEDHVDPALIATDVEAAGLLPLVHRPIVGEPWPTLGEMIGSGSRLVVMVEESDGGEAAPWLVNGFDHTQDTPYTFPSVESFSCAANRGPDDAPLLLLNHWLSGFSSLVTDAQQVNTSAVLLARAVQCRDERGQIPNFVAVNFVAIGDVDSVVDELNGVT